MSYSFQSSGFDSVFNNIPAHPPYSADPVSSIQNHGPATLANLQHSSEVHSQSLNYSTLHGDSSNSQQQRLHASPSMDMSTQWWNYSPTAVPPSSSSLSGLYVNPQASLGQQQEQQRYSAQNLEYHQPSHPQHHSQHTLPTLSSSAHDNARPVCSYQTFVAPPPVPATGSHDPQSSVPATSTRVVGSVTDAKYQPTAISYDESNRISDKVLNRVGQANISQGNQQLDQTQLAATYAYQTSYGDFQRQWSMPQSSFSRRSSSLANALEPVPANPPAQQDRSPIKFEAVTPRSHNVQSATSSTPSQSQSSQVGLQAPIYPISSTPGASKTNSCHVADHRPRATHLSMPASSTAIQIPKLHSTIKQLSTSPPSKLSASPPSSQWSSPGPMDSKDELRQSGRNVAVLIPPSSMQKMPLQRDGAPIASMLTDAVANAHFSVPSLEQAVLPKSVPSTMYALSSMSLPGTSIGKLHQQMVAAARKRGMSMPQHGGTSVQHFSPYMAAKEQRDAYGRKSDAARLAELHAAHVAATGIARGGSSTLISSGPVGFSGLVSSAALYPPTVLAKLPQLPQTIAIGSSSGAASAAEGSRSSLSDEGYGKEGKLGKKPFLACEFCRHRKIACGKGPTLPPDIVLPPGPRTCNQCFRRGLECQFPVASRRGLRHGKPSRRVIYGENNEYRIVDPEEEDFDDDEDEYLEEVEEVDVRGKGKGKAKVPARPWSPIRFVPAVDTEILKELSRKGVIERGGYV